MFDRSAETNRLGNITEFSVVMDAHAFSREVLGRKYHTLVSVSINMHSHAQWGNEKCICTQCLARASAMGYCILVKLMAYFDK